MGGFASLDEVTWSQAIHAEVMGLQGRHHLVMGERLEARTGVKRVLLVLADDALHGGLGSTGESRHRISSGCDILRWVRFVAFPSRHRGLRSLGTKIDEL